MQLLETDEMTLGELQESLSATYLLYDDITLRIVLRYYTPKGKDGKRVPQYINKEDVVLFSANRVKAGGYTLMVQYVGETKTRDGDKH